MRINITRPLVCLLVTWILSAVSLLLWVSPSLADGAQAVDADRSVESAVPVSLSPARGAGDPNPILDDDPVVGDQDFGGKDASTPSGFEDAQYVVSVVLFQPSRATIISRAAHFESTTQVEPRLLRYSRLLY